MWGTRRTHLTSPPEDGPETETETTEMAAATTATTRTETRTKTKTETKKKRTKKTKTKTKTKKKTKTTDAQRPKSKSTSSKSKSEPAESESSESEPKSKPDSKHEKDKAKTSLARVLDNNSDEEILSCWRNLLEGVTSKYDSTKKNLVWNEEARVVQDSEGNERCRWTVNVSRFGVGLKDGVSIIPYHLALLSRMERCRDDDDDDD